MVCQSASQTKFKALKHESGIPGRATIIVRVIACFQPLQNCQAEYFRQLLKPVPGNHWYQHHKHQITHGFTPDQMGTGSKLRPPLGQYPPAWNPNHVSALLQLGQQVNLASFPDPSKFTANPVSPKLETAHQVMPSGGSCQKRILIFDQSGDQTRLFIGPSFYQSELLLSKKKTFGGYETYNDHTQPIVEAQPNNSSPQSSCKESEMHEDSEDINALLYSDDSYANDDDDDVTSTGHSPFMEIAHEEEMASSDDGPLSKRQRLYDDCGDKKSFTDTVNSGNSPLTCSNQEKEGSSCVKGSPNESDREKRLKIRKKLKMLRGLIMGLNSDDPLVVIDEAISYLNLLRVKVKEEMRGENGV